MDNANNTLPNNPLQNIGEWQHKEEVAYWKSLATSLYYENQMMHTHLKDVYKEMLELWQKGWLKIPNEQVEKNISASHNMEYDAKFGENVPQKPHEPNIKNICDYRYTQSPKGSTEVDEVREPISFVSRKNKMRYNAKKRRELIEKSREKIIEPLLTISNNRSEVLKELYGPHSSQIAGIETALQLNFERAVESSQLKPCLWPELQLNLGFGNSFRKPE